MNIFVGYTADKRENIFVDYVVERIFILRIQKNLKKKITR